MSGISSFGRIPRIRVHSWRWRRTRVPRSPQLPDGIDTVWVALWQRSIDFQSNASTLWRLTPPGPWEILNVPAVRDYAWGLVGRSAAAGG